VDAARDLEKYSFIKARRFLQASGDLNLEASDGEFAEKSVLFVAGLQKLSSVDANRHETGYQPRVYWSAFERWLARRGYEAI